MLSFGKELGAGARIFYVNSRFSEESSRQGETHYHSFLFSSLFLQIIRFVGAKFEISKYGKTIYVIKRNKIV